MNNPAYANNLLKTTQIQGNPVKVYPHWNLNSSKGVIWAGHLKKDTDEEITEYLSSQGVTSAKRILTKRDGKLTPTDSFILTFNSSKLPDEIKIAYMKCKVKPYIPQPLRCFKCQMFGHGSKNCLNVAVCAKCGEKAVDGHT